MMMNTISWCKHDVFQRMLAVAAYHANIEKLFNNSGNQQVLEVAVASVTHYSENVWNCRGITVEFARESSNCHIVHTKEGFDIPAEGKHQGKGC